MRLLSRWLKCRPTCSRVYEIAGGEKREYATTLSESIHVLASLSQQRGLLSSDIEVRRRVFVPDVGHPV